jgi:carbamate kinase
VDKLTVIALGGNALVREGEKGTLAEQQEHVEESVTAIVRCCAQGLPLIITHGNGPVVGQLLIRNELAKSQVPRMPLHIMDAESQGSVGFLLTRALGNKLRQTGVPRAAVAVVTQVVVDRRDPSFRRPTKPVGVFYSRDEAERLRRENEWVIEEDAGRGYRRRVASPRPLRIPEAEVIGRLAAAGVITVAAGGGGVPVFERPDGGLEGIDAVVDKDRASAVLGRQAGAERLIILTSVDAVYTGFGTPAERPLRRTRLSEVQALLAAGEFPPGSMGPKIEATIEFLAQGGREVRIGLPEEMEELLGGQRGTLVVSD